MLRFARGGDAVDVYVSLPRFRNGAKQSTRCEPLSYLPFCSPYATSDLLLLPFRLSEQAADLVSCTIQSSPMLQSEIRIMVRDRKRPYLLPGTKTLFVACLACLLADELTTYLR